MTYQSIKSKPWEKPGAAWQAPGLAMLNAEEQRMLRWMAREYCDGSGAIIDAGCFCGGSTACLAQGLRESGRHEKIQTYDRFQAGPYEASRLGRSEGDSFRDLFDEQVEPYRDLVDVHEGDFLGATWDNLPVQLLFIDLAKAAQLNDHVMRLFFHTLVPGKSIVVHQDYLWRYLPWIHISMEKLSDHFEVLCDTGRNSVVYGVRSTISKEAIEAATWNGMDASERVELMDSAIAKWSGEKQLFLIQAKSSFNLLQPIASRTRPFGVQGANIKSH